MRGDGRTCHNDSEARWARRYAQRRYDRDFRQRHYVGNPSLTTVKNIEVPEDVERRDEHSPCFMCGVREGCRHRPWMLAS